MNREKYIIPLLILLGSLILYHYYFESNNLETFENNDESNNIKNNKNTEKSDTSGPNWRGETDPDNALIPYKYMKKNIDAKYQLNRLNEDSEDTPKEIIAPVTEPDSGRNSKFKSSNIKLSNVGHTTRVPDDNSTEEEIKIPHPSTEPTTTIFLGSLDRTIASL